MRNHSPDPALPAHLNPTEQDQPFQALSSGVSK